jgi:hypothetical protein
MDRGEKNLAVLLKNMKPELYDGEFVFCNLSAGSGFDFHKIIMFFKEKEGITVITTKQYADEKGWPYATTFAWIALTVHSSLEAVGLTAAFSAALAAQNISCNVVAAYYHDHIFVPYDSAAKAMDALENLT